MKTKNKPIAFMICVCLMSFLESCHSKLDDTDFIEYVKDDKNGVYKHIEVGEWIYDIQYKPTRLIQIQEHQIQPEQIKRRKAQLEKTVWFTIAIKHAKDALNPLKYKVSGIEEYNTRLDYFLNYAQKEISLEYQNDILKPISYLFENNYGLTPNETMIIGFELPLDITPKEQMTLVYNDLIFKNGIIKANFRKEDISEVNNL